MESAATPARRSPAVRHSSIDELAQVDPGLPGLVRTLLAEPGQTYESIRRFLAERVPEELVPSKSALSRDRRATVEALDRIRAGAETQRELLAFLEANPGWSMPKLLFRLAVQDMTRRMTEDLGDDEAKPIELDRMMASTAKLGQVLIAAEKLEFDRKRLELQVEAAERKAAEYERSVRERMQSAAKEVEKVAKDGGLSRAALKQIREQVFGIVDPHTT